MTLLPKTQIARGNINKEGGIGGCTMGVLPPPHTHTGEGSIFQQGVGGGGVLNDDNVQVHQVT